MKYNYSEKYYTLKKLRSNLHVLCKIMIWAPVTPRDPRLISDPITIVQGLKLKNLHELYEYTL